MEPFQTILQKLLEGKGQTLAPSLYLLIHQMTQTAPMLAC